MRQPQRASEPRSFQTPEDEQRFTIEDRQRLIRALEELAENTSAIVHSARSTGGFIKRYGPWIIAAIGSWVGISPTVIKALLAATGHPTP